MTYEELKSKREWMRSISHWGEDDTEILANVKTNLIRNGGRQYAQLLTDIDPTLNTTAKELIEALQKAGFPADLIKVERDDMAQIQLGGVACTITTTSRNRSLLYESNNTRRFIEFGHTPAELLAAYLVDRYCTDDWVERESLRRLHDYKADKEHEAKARQLKCKYFRIGEEVANDVVSGQDYLQHQEAFRKACIDFFQYDRPESTEDEINDKVEQEWNMFVTRGQEDLKAEERARKAHEKYMTVTKPRQEARQQEIIEQKRALLKEYKEQYGVECKFIYVNSFNDPHHRFVVPAADGQVVSFFVPKTFERRFYDNAMKLVTFLNELTVIHGKRKVQKKGSLPKEADKALVKLVDKLGIRREWQGIYNESQRHYLDDHYRNEIALDPNM